MKKFTSKLKKKLILGFAAFFLMAVIPLKTLFAFGYNQMIHEEISNIDYVIVDDESENSESELSLNQENGSIRADEEAVAEEVDNENRADLAAESELDSMHEDVDNFVCGGLDAVEVDAAQIFFRDEFVSAGVFLCEFF